MSLALISKADYVGFRNIDWSNSETDAVITVYADQLDEYILTRLFGSAMYADIVTNPTTTPNAYLINNFLKKMQVGFFYYYYLADKESFSTSIGEFESDAENAVRNSDNRNIKMVKQHNVGVVYYNLAREYVVENSDDYTLYDSTADELRDEKPINIFGI